MLAKLAAIREKYLHLEEQMSDPATISNMSRLTKISREYKSLEPLMEAFSSLEKTQAGLESARKMLAEETDEELREMARDEIGLLENERQKMEADLKILLIPRDPEDEKNIILEIRSGTGGDEASLFAGDLFKMYGRFFSEMGWKMEVIDENPGTLGGFSKLILEVSGEGVYGKMKFESGAHRVQRVPETESKGRVHTSAATVAVLPKLELEDIDIRKEDIRTDTFRASGAGGQHVNKTESGVRFTHIPTGIVAESTESRSQHQNRDIAMGRLVQQIKEGRQNLHQSGIAAERKSLVGSGDRSEKIRTYNFPQNRVTDHRLEGENKNWPLEGIVSGNIGQLIEALIVADNANRLSGEQEA